MLGEPSKIVFIKDHIIPPISSCTSKIKRKWDFVMPFGGVLQIQGEPSWTAFYTILQGYPTCLTMFGALKYGQIHQKTAFGACRIFGFCSTFVSVSLFFLCLWALVERFFLSRLGQSRPIAGKALTGSSGQNTVLGWSQRLAMGLFWRGDGTGINKNVIDTFSSLMGVPTDLLDV